MRSIVLYQCLKMEIYFFGGQIEIGHGPLNLGQTYPTHRCYDKIVVGGYQYRG